MWLLRAVMIFQTAAESSQGHLLIENQTDTHLFSLMIKKYSHNPYYRKSFQPNSKITYSKRDSFEKEIVSLRFWLENGNICHDIFNICQNRKIHTGPTVDFGISDCSRGHHIRLRGHHSCLCGHCSICWSETRIRWLGQFLTNILFDTDVLINFYHKVLKIFYRLELCLLQNSLLWLKLTFRKKIKPVNPLMGMGHSFFV